jgi:hypothetical protein
VKVDDLLSANEKHRTKALGTLKNALIETGAFDPRFEARFSRFVDNRNHFVHHFWFDTLRKSNGRPSWRQLKETEKFISSLMTEATALLPPFQGLFYAIGNGIADKSNQKSGTAADVLIEWSEYEGDLLSVLRRSDLQNSASTRPGLRVSTR